MSPVKPRGATTFQNSQGSRKAGNLSRFLPISCFSLVKVYIMGLCLPNPSESVTRPLPQSAGEQEPLRVQPGQRAVPGSLAVGFSFGSIVAVAL